MSDDGPTASDRIDERIATLLDWRGETLALVRAEARTRCAGGVLAARLR